MIIEILKEIIIKSVNAINKNVKQICSTIFLVLTIISILNCNDETKYTYVWALIAVFIGLSMVCILDTKIKQKEKQIKMPKERFTKKTANGDVYISENKLNQAIIFLGILEDDLYGEL